MKILVTIKTKSDNPMLDALNLNRPIMMCLQGDCENLQNLISELNEVKNQVNADVNRLGLSLKDVEIKVKLKPELLK